MFKFTGLITRFLGVVILTIILGLLSLTTFVNETEAVPLCRLCSNDGLVWVGYWDRQAKRCIYEYQVYDPNWCPVRHPDVVTD